MTTASEYFAASGTFMAWASGYEGTAANPTGWSQFSRLGNSGEYLTPIDESMVRLGQRAGEAAEDLRRLATVCERRAWEVVEFRQRLENWNLEYGSVPISNRPPRPLWGNTWSYL